MTSQQQQMRLAEELVAAARRKSALQSNPYELVDNRSIGTNFGNKFNRNAPYVRAGALDAPRGADSYTQTIEYHGYQRQVISRNPLLFDEYGDLIEEDSSDEEGDKPEGVALEDNPYEGIKIGELLRPLTSAAELPTHPAFSRPYHDTGLLEMVRNAEKTLHQEQQKLLALRAQFVRFRGDLDWVPVGDMHSEHDDWLFQTVYDGTPLANAGLNGYVDTTEEPPVAQSWNRDNRRQEDDVAPSPGKEQSANDMELDNPQDVAMPDEEADTNSALALEQGDSSEKPAIQETQIENTHPQTNGHSHGNHEQSSKDDDIMAVDNTMPSTMIIQVPPENPANTTNLQRMTTRALTTEVADQDSQPQIHPFFTHPPPIPVPQPDAQNADVDPLDMLNVYISKQTEIVRLWDSLLQGLLKSLRLRKQVFKWCKAEGHVGEMSDGEDWVDLDEWGLHPEELTKGKDEDEQEALVEGHGTGRRGRRGGRGGGAGAADRG